TLTSIVRIERHCSLKHGRGFVELFEPHETSRVSMESWQPRFEKSSSFFEMGSRRGAVSPLILKYSEHPVAGHVIRLQTKQMLQKRNSIRATRVVFDLRGSVQGENVIRGKFQRPAERCQCVRCLTQARIRGSLHRPQPRIARKLFECRTE